jgi:hypothetical protein
MVENDGQDADLAVPGGCLYHTVPIRFVHPSCTRNTIEEKYHDEKVDRMGI